MSQGETGGRQKLTLGRLLSSDAVGDTPTGKVSVSSSDSNSSSVFEKLFDVVNDQQLTIKAHENILVRAVDDPMSLWRRASRRHRGLDAEAVGSLPPFRKRVGSLGQLDERIDEQQAIDDLERTFQEALRTNNMARVKPQRFEVGVDEVDEWLTTFERTCRVNKWDDDDCLANLGCYLAGAPLKCFVTLEESHAARTQGLPGRPKMRWEDVKKALLDEFVGDFKKGEWKSALRNRVQASTESIEEYVYDVIALCRKVDPAMAELDKVQAVMSGLLPSVLDKISMLENSTITQLKNNLKKAQSSKFLLQQRMVKGSESRRETEGVVASVSATPSKDLTDLQQQLLSVAQELAAQREMIVSAVQVKSQNTIPHHFTQLGHPPPLTTAQPVVHSPVYYPYQLPQHFLPGPQQYDPNVNYNLNAIYGQQQQAGGSYSQQPHQQQVNPDQGTWRERQRQHTGRPVCFLCQKVGHVILRCPDLHKARVGLQGNGQDNNAPSTSGNA